VGEREPGHYWTTKGAKGASFYAFGTGTLAGQIVASKMANIYLSGSGCLGLV
jgi:hypothetical protein